MKKYNAFLFVMLLSSCELIVDVDVPFEEHQLVVNSFFNPDSVWSAAISLNRHILSDVPYVRVENAIVVIYQSGSPIDTLIHQEYGMYKSKDNKPLIGVEYEIRATTGNFDANSRKTKIPKPAQITNVEIEEGHNIDQPSSIVQVTFTDDRDEVNYYQINVDTEREWLNPSDGEIYTNRYRVMIESNDLNVQNGNTYWDGGILMKDILFNGKEVNLSFNTQSWEISNAGKVIVTLQTLSEEEYTYKATVQLQNETSGDPFAQPVNVSGNIENGFGIFAGHSQSMFIKVNPKPVILEINPAKGKIGDHIIISGENLQGGSVSFSSNEFEAFAQTVRSSESEIEVIVPERAITGKIIVYTNAGAFMSHTDFEVLN